jgi:hypothetical protein
MTTMDETADPRAAMRAKDAAAGMDPTLLERFMTKTELDPATGCLNWTGATSGDAYGYLRFEGRPQRVHRLAYKWFVGPIPEDTPVVRHRCDNPTCVNPGHLLDGTKADNVADMLERGRQTPPSVPLKEDEKQVIVGLHAMGHSQNHVADCMGVSLNTVKRVLRDARKDHG